MISTFAAISAALYSLTFLFLLFSKRIQLPVTVRSVLCCVCVLAAVVHVFNFWSWLGVEVQVQVFENWGDYLQILQPALWGMLFYVVVQADQREKLEHSRQQMRDLVENMPVILHAYDSEGCPLAWNRYAEEVTGYGREEVIGQKQFLNELFTDAEYRGQLLAECQSRGAGYTHRLRPIRCKQQYEKQIAWYNISQRFPIDGWANWGIGLDVTEQVTAQRELEHMATHDELTGLANRALLRDRLSHALIDSKRNERRGALLLLDLDHFKMINDAHGHPVGDRLLREIGERLATCLKSTDTLARFGGDEFVILLERISHPEEASMVAERIIATLTGKPFQLFGQEIRIRTSIGITVFPDDDVRLDELIKNVDLALYAAKESGRNGYHFYSRAMHNKLRWQHRVAERLRAALQGESFGLHYQPQVCLRSRAVVGLEALIRWNAFDEVPLSPSVFMPIAENMGLMPNLGRWVVEAVCRQAATWKADNLTTPLSINLSAVQLFQPNLVETLTTIAETYAINPQNVEFEITETAVMRNLDSALATMRKLSSHGFKIALDDFGTGHSSLSYLKRFPVSKIKIDQSFVRGVETDPVDAAIVRSVIGLGHSMNMKVLAEGVETAGQYERLAQEGCDYIQGFFFSKPLMADLVPAFIEARASSDRVDMRPV